MRMLGVPAGQHRHVEADVGVHADVVLQLAPGDAVVFRRQRHLEDRAARRLGNAEDHVRGDRGALRVTVEGADGGAVVRGVAVGLHQHRRTGLNLRQVGLALRAVAADGAFPDEYDGLAGGLRVLDEVVEVLVKGR